MGKLILTLVVTKEGRVSVLGALAGRKPGRGRGEASGEMEAARRRQGEFSDAGGEPGRTSPAWPQATQTLHSRYSLSE